MEVEWQVTNAVFTRETVTSASFCQVVPPPLEFFQHTFYEHGRALKRLRKHVCSQLSEGTLICDKWFWTAPSKHLNVFTAIIHLILKTAIIRNRHACFILPDSTDSFHNSKYIWEFYFTFFLHSSSSSVTFFFGCSTSKKQCKGLTNETT